MHPLTTITVTALLFCLRLTASFPLNDIGLSNCNQNFSCGNLTDITYPFTGGQRPPYCGPPEFYLKCLTDTTTILITNDSLSYRVIDLNQTSQTLRLSRLDLYDTACTHQFINTTLNNTIFSLGPDLEILSLFYGCNNVSDSALSSEPWLSNSTFFCDMNGVSRQGFYVLGSDVAIDPLSELFEYCPINVQVPIPVSWADKIWTNGSLLGEGLAEGFDVNYSNPYWNDCVECYKHPGGQCGFNATLGKPICICGDKLCPGFFNTTVAGFFKNRWRLITAIAIPAIVAVMVAVAYTIVSKGKGISGGKRIPVCWESSTKCNKKLEAFMVNYHSLTPKRYSYSDVKKMTNSFNTKLGQGGFGCVYKGKLPDGRPVAVKVLTKFKTEGEEFMNEVASISRTSHVNIVTLLGFSLERGKKVLIYEYMPNGSLDRFISYEGCPHTNRLLEWKTLYEIAVGIARGLEYLHRGCNTRIVHFDIKPHNILLDEDFCPKISDFGLAKLCKTAASKVSVTGTRGTAGYIAPEVFCRNFGGVSYKSDVYSYGMMILEMVGERKRTDGGLSETSETYFPDWFYKHLEPGEISRLHEGITKENEEIARKMILVGLWCIQMNPSDRPSMTKVVEMLEGSLQSLQIPPKPSFSSPIRSLEELFSTTSSPPSAWSQKDEEKKLSVDEADHL